MATINDNHNFTAEDFKNAVRPEYPPEFIEALCDMAEHQLYTWLDENAPKEIRGLFERYLMARAYMPEDAFNQHDVISHLTWDLAYCGATFHGENSSVPSDRSRQEYLKGQDKTE